MSQPAPMALEAAPFDLEAYFARIGYRGPRTPTLETLRGIHLQHAISIPFENLNSLLRIPVLIDLPSIQRKLIADQRGGYCFEHNALLQRALQELGFEVTGLAGRVLWNAPPGVVRPQTHMVLRVDLEDTAWLADVGMGGLTLTGPLRLFSDEAQETPHEPFRVIRVGDWYQQQALIGDEWKPTYQFSLLPQHSVDYQVGNWYVSTCLESHFLHFLMAARPAVDRRTTLINNLLSVYHRDGRIDKQLLTSAAELRSALQETLGIRLPEHPDLEPLLVRLAAMPPMP